MEKAIDVNVDDLQVIGNSKFEAEKKFFFN